MTVVPTESVKVTPDTICMLNISRRAKVGRVVLEDQEREGVVEEERDDEERDVAHR